MELRDLDDRERLALVGLAKVLVRADRGTSEQEYGSIHALAREVGVEDFHAAVRQGKERFRSRADVMEHARSVTRQEARNAIYKRLYELAESDAIVTAESRVLHEVADMWDIAEQVV